MRRGVSIRGDQLKRLCAERRLTGTALANRVGRTNRHLYRLMGDEGEHASLDLLDRLAGEFGVATVAEMIVDDEDRDIFLAYHAAREPA